jgi:hypothetical protein
VRSIAGTSAASSGLIVLNGADNVTIDGSLDAANPSRDMTITNDAAPPSTSVIWIRSASASDGATGNTVQNCVIRGGGSGQTTTSVGIMAGGSTATGPADAPNSNNTIKNNAIAHVQNGIFQSGYAATGDDNWQIVDNVIGSTLPADKLLFRGALVGNVMNLELLRNTIRGVVAPSTSSSSVTGLSIQLAVFGGEIRNNSISDVRQRNPDGWGASGIYIHPTTTASNLLVANNIISDVAGEGFNDTTVEDNGYGIVVRSGGGIRIYNNTVHLNRNQGVNAAVGNTAALNVMSTESLAGTLDVQQHLLERPDHGYALRRPLARRRRPFSRRSTTTTTSRKTSDGWGPARGRRLWIGRPPPGRMRTPGPSIRSSSTTPTCT